MVLVISTIMLASVPVRADAGNAQIRVSLRVLPPLVEQQGGRLSGFSVELWNEIARRNAWTSDFQILPDVEKQLQTIANGAADVGVGAISITAQRDLKFDFSQPILNAGLAIMIRSTGATAQSSIVGNLLGLLFSPSILIWLGIALALTVIPAHIVWFIERRHPEGIVGGGKYVPGIFQAFFWGMGTLATQADSMPRHWASRIVAVIWMFTSVVYVAFYTATLTAALTVQQIKGGINGPGDLPGKRVVTVAGSTSEDYLRTRNMDPIIVPTAEDAFHALPDNKAEAIVYDVPVLQFIAAHEGLGRTVIVGSTFQPEFYGFAFRNSGLLRRSVDASLLALREDGTYDRIRRKWFGSEGDKSAP